MTSARKWRSGRRRRSRGQSIVEFALILPVMLLLVMFAIDFGRVYLGWVNLQNMTRVAANFAANNADAWVAPVDAATQARYRELVANDAQAINCTLPDPIPDPVFASGVDLGDLAEVHLDCRFGIITPLIGVVLGDEVLVSAQSSFPIKGGIVGSVPGGGGGPIVVTPDADFVGSPTSGYAPLAVVFTDLSTNAPTSWVWSLGDGSLSFEESPVHTYTTAGVYDVTLTVSNTGGADSQTRTTYITVIDPPTIGPVPEFSATNRFGEAPLDVAFTDESTGSPTTWLWDFGDGATATTANPNHTYTSIGSYAVSLTVSDGTTANTQTKTGYVTVVELPCEVPNFAGTRKNNAQGTWDDAGFTTAVVFAPGSPNGNWIINFQSLPGGLVDPPGGCDATIQVGP
jgi:PKD repeat protein